MLYSFKCHWFIYRHAFYSVVVDAFIISIFVVNFYKVLIFSKDASVPIFFIQFSGSTDGFFFG